MRRPIKTSNADVKWKWPSADLVSNGMLLGCPCRQTHPRCAGGDPPRRQTNGPTVGSGEDDTNLAQHALEYVTMLLAEHP